MQNMKFSIGRMFDESVTSTSFGDIKESYPLYGQIEMVAASSELCTSATLLQLEDDLNCMSKTNEYDDLGMLKNTYVYDKNDSRVMTLTRNYQARTNDSKHISQRINMDTFAFGDESYWVRQYQYDAMGNVTKIYGETPDRHDYTYDYRNFLVNDNGTAYEYDGNGNITKKGATTYTYDTVIKDRLVKVGNTPVTYSTENPLNPATYGNCSYNFKGRRLQSFTKSGSTYNYIYDEQGLRTRKIAPDGSVTKYLYNGTKLAAEIAPNYRLDFLYDENDMLYGFVKDGSAKYFYARDMLQNILGIIDTNGSPVVIYQYTAYGTSTVLQDTAGLANINPFRFKGYYFDSESDMYYCHTRYYVPEWCRWLNADHPSFLQPESLQEMNLFMYCGNNPQNLITKKALSFKIIKSTDTPVYAILKKLYKKHFSSINSQYALLNQTPTIDTNTHNPDDPLKDFYNIDWDQLDGWQKFVGGTGMTIMTIGAVASVVGLILFFIPTFHAAGVIVVAIGYVMMVIGAYIAALAFGVDPGVWK